VGNEGRDPGSGRMKKDSTNGKKTPPVIMRSIKAGLGLRRGGNLHGQESWGQERYHPGMEGVTKEGTSPRKTGRVLIVRSASSNAEWVRSRKPRSKLNLQRKKRQGVFLDQGKRISTSFGKKTGNAPLILMGAEDGGPSHIR